MPTAPNRRLTEEEVAFVIKRATELEASESSRLADDPASALTLDQVEQIAADSQIDPRMVQRAIAELAARRIPIASRSVVARMIGSHEHVEVQRASDSHLSSDKQAEALDVVRRIFDDEGSAVSSESRWEWSSTPVTAGNTFSFGRLIRARIIARRDGTLTRIDENMRPLAIALLTGSVAFGIAAAMVLTSGAFGLPIVRSMAVGLSWLAVGVGASILAARKIFESISSRRAQELSSLADRIDSILTEQPTPITTNTRGKT